MQGNYNWDINKKHYVHPNSDEINSFILQIKKDTATIGDFFNNLFRWFDENIEYSRLNNPFMPLQRSDLDLLHMKSGTCGDYANLIVSILLSLEIPAKYAYLKRDCYGDEQDHICAAAFLDDRWTLIDATLPYRKWKGFDCPHQEYELLEPDKFEQRMKQIECKCFSKAAKWGKPQYAGILYAPWVHEDIVLCTPEQIDSVFYLFILKQNEDWTIYINYLSYTKSHGHTPIMVTITSEVELYQFSVYPMKSIWDDTQWSDALSLTEVPVKFCTPEFHKMRDSMERNIPQILQRIGFTRPIRCT